jgi:hypothetical protein
VVTATHNNRPRTSPHRTVVSRPVAPHKRKSHEAIRRTRVSTWGTLHAVRRWSASKPFIPGYRTRSSGVIVLVVSLNPESEAIPYPRSGNHPLRKVSTKEREVKRMLATVGIYCVAQLLFLSFGLCIYTCTSIYNSYFKTASPAHPFK